jgi:tetraacyldisaccharide 4'-kinase
MGLLELIYYLGYSFKKSRDLRNRRRLPCRVISVGNLTVGGTGKTPAVIAIAEEAKKKGYLPCILTRGYRGKAKGPCIISKGDGALLGVDEAGDEASLMADRLRNVPIVKGGDRYEAGLFALRNLEVFSSREPAGTDRSPVSGFPPRFLFILDDGFQHWRLHRDLDILLIDGADPFGNNRLLPLGRLREPLRELRRADIIVLTRLGTGSDKDGKKTALTREIRRYNTGAPIYTSGHEPAVLRTVSGRDLSLDLLAGKTVFAFCGIGNPSAFRDTLSGINARIKGFIAFRDHFAYRRRDILRITREAGRCNADWIVTTEKDIMRFKDFELAESIVSLRIEFNVERGFYDQLFAEA